MTGRSRARDRSRPSGGALAWTPWSALGGQWFDATDGTSGSPVSAWTARGATAVATQGTVANQPAAPVTNASLGDELASAFDGADRLVSSTALDLSAAWTICAVLSTAALKNEHGVFRLAASESTGGGGVCCYAVLDGRLVIASADTSWYRICTPGIVTGGVVVLAKCAGTSESISVEVGAISGGTIAWTAQTLGALSGTFAMPAASGQYLVLGGGWSLWTSFLSGNLGLIGAAGRDIDAAETASLKGYLAGRFAV